MASAEEERDALRQQNLNLRVVFKEMSEQLSVFKNRCAGVDTVTLMLRESRSEVMKLSRQCKVMEIALANLQNRLTNNGLSSSVNIEETELFVPGASKQTIDNLARENARLKSQLKHSDGSDIKKQSKELEELKSNLDKLEADNNILKSELLDLDSKRQSLINQYEMELNAVTKDCGTSKRTNITMVSTETQTDGGTQLHERSTVGLKGLLAQVSQQCQAWERELGEAEVAKENDLNTQKFEELKIGYDEVVLMNHRWQKHCDVKDMEAHALQARIVELEERIRGGLGGDHGNREALNKEMSVLKGLTERQGTENVQLKQDVARLRGELVACRSAQPKFDMSMVEILKQQIQVCTEDFNTERKDREEAVRKAKTYQEEVNRLAAENNLLRTQLEKLSKESSALQQQKLTPRDHLNPLIRTEYRQSPQPSHPQLSRLYHTPQAPGSLSSGSPGSSMSRISQPFDTSSSQSETSLPTSHSPHPSSHSPILHNPGPQDFTSLPRNTQVHGFEGLPTLSYLEARPGMASMPAPQHRAPMPQHRAPIPHRGQYGTADKGSVMACPKCNQEFSDNETSAFIAHMDSCTQ